MKAFLLDPRKISAPMPGLLKLAVTRAGWTPVSPSVLEEQNGLEWLAKVRSELADADIIIGLGNFLALFQSGTELESLLALLRSKIDAGCPALFDGCDTLFTHAFPDLERQIRVFFDRYGIHLTPIKVASKTREYEAHSSSMCCVFKGDDDSLLDAGLFSGTDSVIGSGSRLIQYDANVFPLIEASGLHFFVDEGDLPAVGNLGRKNAVAVRLARGRQCLIALSGSFLRDRTRTLGGTTPGLEDNVRFAENLIDELTEHGRTHINHALSAFELFCELEVRLGEILETGLTRRSGSSNFFELLPPNVRKRLRTKFGMLDYSRAFYSDLVTILEQYWADFQRYFLSATGESMSPSAVMESLREVNELRKYLAHPAKAQQEKRKITASDVEKLRCALDLIRNASLRLESK